MSNNNEHHLCGGLLGLHALTSVHPGSGTALGTVDLPVQRERHTHWPNIAGSALKGILRDASRERIREEEQIERKEADGHDKLTAVFGPPSGNSSEHAGAISITDARLIAFPVRSLKGVFAWVTCHGALTRLKRDAAIVNLTCDVAEIGPDTNQAILCSGSPCLCPDNQIVLEEFLFSKAEGDASLIAKWMADNLLPSTDSYASTRERIKKQLVILSDDDFTHFAKQATEVLARVGLDYQTKTVKDGALFYQEFLPAETLFYSVVIANSARTRKEQTSASNVLQTVDDHLPGVLQVGGDETTGKGYCSTRLTKGGQR